MWIAGLPQWHLRALRRPGAASTCRARSITRWAVLLALAGCGALQTLHAQERFRFDATPGRLSKQVMPTRYQLKFDLDPARAIIFAWHPVLIFESAHSGHVEAPFIAFLALALVAWAYRRPALTGVSVALAAMIKFYPAVLLPVFFFNPDRGGIERSNIRSPRAWAARRSRGAVVTLPAKT